MRVVHRVVLLIVVAFAAAGSVHARALGLREAQRLAAEHHPSVAAARATADAAAARVAAADAAWWPTIAVGAELIASTTNNSTTTHLGLPGIDLPRIGATSLDAAPGFVPAGSTLVAVGGRQLLWDFGRTASAAAQQRQLLDAARIDGVGVGLDLDLAVAEAFYGVVVARAVETAATSAAARARLYLAQARQAVISGLRPSVEVARVEADVARADVVVVRAGGASVVARARFAATVGVDEPELDAADDDDVATALPTLTAILDAIALDPREAALRARADAERTAADGLDARTRPTLSATAAVSTRAGGATSSTGSTIVGAGLLPIVPNYDVGLLLSWPLLDMPAAASSTATRAAAEARDREADVIRRRRRADVTAAWAAAHAADEAIVALTRADDAARLSAEQAQQRYAAGLGTLIERTDAETLRIAAEVDLARGHADVGLARARLARALATTEQKP